MKNLAAMLCLLMLLLPVSGLAQKTKIYRTKVYHYDHSVVKGIVYDVSPQGVVLLDAKSVSAMSAKDIREALLSNQLPVFTVPFEEIQSININRRRSVGRGFGLGYLVSFVTLETVMAVSTLSSNGGYQCCGFEKKTTLGEALIGASCAAPPGILVMGVVSVVGGGIGSLVGAFPRKQITLDPRNQESDAREKLKKYALLLQKNRS